MLALILWGRLNKILHMPESIYCFFSLIVAGITSTNPGSSWNYLMEFYVAVALLTVRMLSFLQQEVNTKIIVLLLYHSIFSYFHTTYFIVKDIQKVINYSQIYKQTQYRISSLMILNQNILLIRSGVGIDALLSFGKFNLIDLPKELKSKEEELAYKALQTRKIDTVFVGDELIPMKLVK
jgi:hypothetical protein